MADKLMFIKITPVDYTQWLKRLDTQLNEPTNQNSIKVPKVVKLTNKKHYYKTLGASDVINSPLSPLSLDTNIKKEERRHFAVYYTST